jgi:hypothetical protein
MGTEKCDDCGAANPRVSLGDASLCDRCADRRVARMTGYPELPEPPPAISFTAPDGRRHELKFRWWRAPTGVEVEVEEIGVPVGEGYHFAVLGAHDAEVDELVAQVTQRAETEIGRQYLEPHPDRSGWLLYHDEVAGRLVCSDEHGIGGPYDVIVDGRTLTWAEFGHALEPYEGWRFRLVLEDRCEDVRPDAEVIPLAPSRTEEAELVPEDSPTIDDVLTEFLVAEEQRLAPRTFRNYADVIGLLRNCLNGYGHQSLDAAERHRWETAFDHDEEAFVHLFGADKIAENLGEFLDYFMIRKVIAGEELLRSAGTVTKKLVKWLGERGYLDQTAVDVAVDRAADATRDLPKAEKLSRLLFEQSSNTRLDLDALDDNDYVEDYLMIDKVEPGALWFEGGIGPVKVPRAASNIARVGWSVNIVLGRARQTWHILEVGSVYP